VANANPITIRDTPAAKAGVLANDIVTHIDDEPLQGLTRAGQHHGPPEDPAQRQRADRGVDRPRSDRVAAGDLKVAVTDGKLMVGASGNLPIHDFDLGVPVAITAVSENEFFVEGSDHTRLAFERDEAGRSARLVLNPGPWQITGQRIN
jgi:hypothetical protein